MGSVFDYWWTWPVLDDIHFDLYECPIFLLILSNFGVILLLTSDKNGVDNSH